MYYMEVCSASQPFTIPVEISGKLKIVLRSVTKLQDWFQLDTDEKKKVNKCTNIPVAQTDS